MNQIHLIKDPLSKAFVLHLSLRDIFNLLQVKPFNFVINHTKFWQNLFIKNYKSNYEKVTNKSLLINFLEQNQHKELYNIFHQAYIFGHNAPETVLNNFVKLDLSSNMYDKLMYYIPSLKYLLLSHQKGLKLSHEIKNLQQLYHLEIKLSSIILLPLELYTLPNLDRLGINECNFSVIPEDFAKLQQLTCLSLCGNNIFYIKTLCALTNLRNLTLSHNKIQKIPHEIQHLKKLLHLNLSNNELCSIMELTSLTNLNTLNLSHNKLMNIPIKIGKMKNLTHLILKNNLIRYIPTEIVNLKQLFSLNISNNYIKELPSSFSQLNILEYLSLNNNNIKDFTNVCNCRKLNSLYLHHNKITFIPEEFIRLKKLQIFDITYNEIREITKEWIIRGQGLNINYPNHGCTLTLTNNRIIDLEPLGIYKEELNTVKIVFVDKKVQFPTSFEYKLLSKIRRI